jgi:hypothetical protein
LRRAFWGSKHAVINVVNVPRPMFVISEVMDAIASAESKLPMAGCGRSRIDTKSRWLSADLGIFHLPGSWSQMA